MRKMICAFMLVLLMGTAFALIGHDRSGEVEGEPTRLQSPLRVDNDTIFFNLSVSMGWTGDGSSGDPFIIEDHVINASGFGCGIYIGNVTYSFIIRNCRVHNTTPDNGYYYWGAGIALFNVIDAQIESSHISDCRIGIMISGSRGVIVNDTKVERAHYQGIYIPQSRDVLVRDNMVRDSSNGISAGSGSQSIRIQGNDLRYGEGHGIGIISETSSCNVTQNLIRDYSRWGVYISVSTGCRVWENDIERSTTGVYLDRYIYGRSINWNLVRRNSITECFQGIFTFLTSNTIIEGNNISYCKGNGIEIGELTDNATVRDNILWHNLGYGVLLAGENNLIYNNTFHFNNGTTDVYDPLYVQGYDGGYFNGWYEDGRGNVWSDWRGPDENEDGIVDRPYRLDGPANNSDPYPISDHEPPQLNPPGDPISLASEIGRFFVNLTWQEPIDDGGSPVTGYRIYRARPGVNAHIIREVPAEKTFFNDTDLKENTSYTYRVSAVNDMGEGPLSDPLFATTPVPLGAPRIRITHPLQDEVLAVDHVTVEWSYTVANGTLDHMEVNHSDRWVDVGNSTSYDMGSLSNTGYVFGVRLITEEGLQAVDNVSFDVSVPAPLVEITAPTITLLNDDPVMFEWTFSSTGSTIVEVEYRIDDGNWTYAGLNTSVSFSDLPDGPHLFEVMVTDAGGRTASDELGIVVDRIPPAVVDNGPLELDTPPDTVVYVLFEEPVRNSSVEIWLDPDVNGTLTVTNGTLARFIPDAPLEPGVTYTVNIRAMDHAGNLLFPYSWSFKVEEYDVLTKVFGYVVDSDGRPIQGAVVTLSQFNDTTNAYGHFEFMVAPGDHHLSVYRRGYRPFSIDIFVSSTDEFEVGRISLEVEKDQDGPEDDEGVPWIPILIFIFGGIVAIGYFTLRKQTLRDEVDIEE